MRISSLYPYEFLRQTTLLVIAATILIQPISYFSEVSLSDIECIDLEEENDTVENQEQDDKKTEIQIIPQPSLDILNNHQKISFFDNTNEYIDFKKEIHIPPPKLS